MPSNDIKGVAHPVLTVEISDLGVTTAYITLGKTQYEDIPAVINHNRTHGMLACHINLINGVSG